MTEPKEPASHLQPKRRGWLRRTLKIGLVLLLLAVVFHRPLIRFIVIRVASTQRLALDFHFSGTLFTNLVIEKVNAVPNGKGVTPVEKIAIEKLRFDYSIPLLVRHGLGEFLRSYEMRHADLRFVAVPSKTKQERKEKLGLAEQIRAILAQPAAYSDRVEIEDFNIRVRSATNETAVEGIDLLLAPDRVGHLRIKHIAVPGVPVWDNLQAETSYTARNLFIKNLTITPDLVVQDLNFDASQRAQNKGSVSLKARVFGGEIAVAIAGDRLDGKGENLEHSYDTKTRLTINRVNVRAAAAYFGVKNLPVETLAAVDSEFSGEPEKPQSWIGRAAITVEGINAGAVRIEQVNLQAMMDRGAAKTNLEVALAGNTLKVVATAVLPPTINEFSFANGEATVQLDASQLAKLGEVLKLAQPLSGTASLEGKVKSQDRVASADLTLKADKLAAGEIGAETARIQLSATKRLGQPGLAGLAAQVDAGLNALRFKTFTADALTLRGSSREQAVTLQTLEVTRGENAVSARGTYVVPQDFKEAAKAPVDAHFTIKVPDLAAFGIAVKEQKLEGRISAQGAVKLVDGSPVGGIELEGGAFKLGGFAAERLATKVQFADRTAQIEQFAFQINATDQLAITGKVGVEKPNTYEGALQVGVQNLAVFQPLLEIFGIKEALTGALEIDWKGKGAIEPRQHEGELKAGVAKAKYGKVDLSEFRLAGLYGPAFAKTTEFRATSGSTKFAGQIDFSEGKLRLRDIDLQQGAQQALTGFVIVPFNPQNSAGPFPLEERIAANVNVSKLDLDKLFASLGKPAPVRGTINASLVTGGTLLNPAGRFQLQARALKTKAAEKLDAAEVDFSLHYSDKLLELEATARQREIQPLVIRGKLPLDLEKAVKDKAYDPALPIDFSVKLAPTSLAAVPKFVPAVRRIDGTAGLDLSVGGTFGKPVIKLGVAVDLKSARLAAATAPSIGAFEARIGYANGVLSIPTCKGELGGGTFKLSGTVKTPELEELSFGPEVRVPKTVAPVFDLRFEADEVLLLRNDLVTVRADSDLKFAGSIQAAALTGTAYIVHSRFFKDLDILPLLLPGKAKPAPKAVKQEANVSFPNPPLRDWKFDVAIKTREDDPFKITGNLATGGAALSLRFAGTGLKPYLEGNVRIDNFKASLPFSTLSISRGFVYFKPEAPFKPSLDIQAESRMRDYLISAYIYGTASDPQLQLSSEPPLAHADLVSLLATGTTTAELGQGAEALASRAAILAIKQLYQKLFKRGAGAPAQKEDAGSVLDRFDVEIGATDNRTGQQEAVGRFRINDQYYVIGEAGVNGEVNGRLQYLLRFR